MPAPMYALGCVLYEMLSGEVPYALDSDMAKMWAHVNREPPSLEPSSPHLAARFDHVVVRAMAKRPEDRFPSAGDLGRAFQAAEQGERSTAPERSVAAGLAAPTRGAETRPAHAVTPPPGHPPERDHAQTSEANTQALDGERRSRLPAILLSVALLVLGVGAGVFGASELLSGDDPPTRPDPASRAERDAPQRERSSDADASSQADADTAEPPSGAEPSYEPYTPTDPGFAGYSTEIPAGWTLEESEPNPGQRFSTELTGSDGLSLLIDYTPFEPPGEIQEGGGLTLEGPPVSAPVGSNTADKYVFSGGVCPAARCVDYLITLPSGGGVAVLGGADDLGAIEPIARHVAGSVTPRD